MLSVESLSLKLGEFSLHDINLEVSRGDYFVLLGPSGAGKTVLFETIAGINIPDSGKVILSGKDITNVKIRKRKIGLVFQDGAVFPHLTVYQNIRYPLKIKRLTEKEVGKTIKNLAEQMDITHLLHRKPSTLSGGELRRTAIARTLALKPECLLLDEPLSSIDSQLRDEIMGLLKKLNKTGLTILHITHDYREAFYAAGKIAVMDKGRIIQQGSPGEIVAHPRSKFIAGFIGIKNYFGFKASGQNEIIIADSLKLKLTGRAPESGNVVIPQESFRILPDIDPDSGPDTLKGRIIDMVHFPDNMELTVDIGFPLHVILNPALASELITWDTINIKIDTSKVVFF